MRRKMKEQAEIEDKYNQEYNQQNCWKKTKQFPKRATKTGVKRGKRGMRGKEKRMMEGK